VAKRDYFRVFYARRTFRIFPLYIAWATLGAAFLALAPKAIFGYALRLLAGRHHRW